MGENDPFEVTESDVDSLRREWRCLIQEFSSADGPADQAFRSLCELYSSPERFYHNLSHIRFLLSGAASIQETLAGYVSVRLAIWFHDAIYDTQKTDNELRSAELAGTLLTRLDAPKGLIQTVHHMITATEHHTASDDIPDLNAFLDLDLSILGAPDSLYRRYSLAIRQEYAWVPEAMYRQARSDILKGFLKRDRIFYTGEARKGLEAQARINIGREIETLQATA